jgi:hypothetical protein
LLRYTVAALLSIYNVLAANGMRYLRATSIASYHNN